MYKIPRRFTLANREWKVKFTKKGLDDDTDGLCRSREAEILIRPRLPKDLRDHTFLHELNHAILDTMGQTKLSHDEGFVDGHAALLHQVLKQLTVEG